MRFCFFITVALAVAGLIYNDFSAGALLALIFISVSSLPLLLLSFGIREASIHINNSSRLLILLRAVFFLLSLLNLIIFVRRHGFGLSDLVSSDGIINLAVQSTLERYQYGSTEGNPLLVAATFINAFLWPSSGLSMISCVVLGLLPAGIYTVISTEKWPLYCAMSFFVASKLLIATEREGGSKDYMGVITVAAIGGVVGIGSLILRQGISSLAVAVDALGDIGNILAHYLFAQYDAFGQWLAGRYAECCTMGQYTFVGFASYVGWAEREQGVFPEVVLIHGMETNIYTAWRYWVQDFSVVGPLIIISLFSLVYRYAFIKNHAVLTAALLVLLMMSSFLQINTTIFVHNSVALACVICALSVVSFRTVEKSPLG